MGEMPSFSAKLHRFFPQDGALLHERFPIDFYFIKNAMYQFISA
jgi:hypothetical protein